MKADKLSRIELVDWKNPDASMPNDLEQGVLYIHYNCRVSIHLCACGCGNQTVLPFHYEFSDQKGKWQLITKKIEGTTEADRPYDFTATFKPSIGNYNFPCKSHYYITDNNIQWL